MQVGIQNINEFFACRVVWRAAFLGHLCRKWARILFLSSHRVLIDCYTFWCAFATLFSWQTHLACSRENHAWLDFWRQVLSHLCMSYTFCSWSLWRLDGLLSWPSGRFFQIPVFHFFATTNEGDDIHNTDCSFEIPIWPKNEHQCIYQADTSPLVGRNSYFLTWPLCSAVDTIADCFFTNIR